MLQFGLFEYKYAKKFGIGKIGANVWLLPIAGTGTTGYVARALKRDFVRYSKEISETINFALY